jgi:hypothetical protein
MTTSAVAPLTTSKVVSPFVDDSLNRKSIYDNVDSVNPSSGARRRPAVAISRLAVSATSLIGMLGGGAPSGCDSLLLAGSGGLLPRAAGGTGGIGNLATSTALAASCDDVTTISSNAGMHGQQAGFPQQQASGGTKKPTSKVIPATSFYRSKSTRCSAGKSSRPASDGSTPASTGLLVRTPNSAGTVGTITGSAGAISVTGVECGGSSNQPLEKNASTSSKLRVLTLPTKSISTSVGLLSPSLTKSPTSPGPSSGNVTPAGLANSPASTTPTQQQSQSATKFQFGSRPRSGRSIATTTSTTVATPRVTEPLVTTASASIVNGDRDSTEKNFYRVRDQHSNVNNYCKNESIAPSGSLSTGSDATASASTDTFDSHAANGDATEVPPLPECMSSSAIELGANKSGRSARDSGMEQLLPSAEDDFRFGGRQRRDECDDFQQRKIGFERHRYCSEPDEGAPFSHTDKNDDNGLDEVFGSIMSVEQCDSSTGSTVTINSVVTRCPSVQSQLTAAATDSFQDTAVGPPKTTDDCMRYPPADEWHPVSGSSAADVRSEASSKLQMHEIKTGRIPTIAAETCDSVESVLDAVGTSAIGDKEPTDTTETTQPVSSTRKTGAFAGRTGGYEELDRNGNGCYGVSG